MIIFTYIFKLSLVVMQGKEIQRLVADYGPATSWHMAVWWMFKTGMWFCMWWEAKLDGAEHTTDHAMRAVMQSSPNSTHHLPLVALVAHKAGYKFDMESQTEYMVNGQKEWEEKVIDDGLPSFNYNSTCSVLTTLGFTPCSWAFFQLTRQQMRNPNFSLAELMQIFLQNSIHVEWVTCFETIATKWLLLANNKLWEYMTESINLKLYLVASECSFNKFNLPEDWTRNVTRLLNVFYHLVEQSIQILENTTAPASDSEIATFFGRFQENTASNVFLQDIMPTLVRAFDIYSQ